MKFRYHGRTLDGFDHPYNDTAENERAVELAVAMDWLAETSGSGLEVGNVLGWYGVAGHRVVDRYELADGVENIDVFDIAGEYVWIIAISTVEHVGQDSDPKDPQLAAMAIEHLQSLLTPEGRMLVTVPGGYHQALDAQLRLDGAGATRDCTLIRDRGGWRQTADRVFLPYGKSTPWAESIWIGEWEGGAR